MRSAKEFYEWLDPLFDLAEKRKDHTYLTFAVIGAGFKHQDRAKSSFRIDDDYRHIDEDGFTVWVGYHMHDTSRAFSSGPDLNRIHLALTAPDGAVLNRRDAEYED